MIMIRMGTITITTTIGITMMRLLIATMMTIVMMPTRMIIIIRTAKTIHNNNVDNHTKNRND